MSGSFCRVDTALTETVCEFIATVEGRLADSFLSRRYGRLYSTTATIRHGIIVFLNIDSSRLFSPLRTTTQTRVILIARSSCTYLILFQLNPVHSFISSNHCLAGLLRDISPSSFPCNVMFAMVPFALTTCPNRLIFLCLTISNSVSYFPVCSGSLLFIFVLCVWFDAPETVFWSRWIYNLLCFSLQSHTTFSDINLYYYS